MYVWMVTWRVANNCVIGGYQMEQLKHDASA